MQKDLDDPYLVTMRATEADVDPADAPDAGSHGMGRDFDDAYSLMVRYPKYVLICFAVLLLLAKKKGPFYFDHGLVGVFAVLSIFSMFFTALFQLVAIPHALWMMFNNGCLRSWQHWLVIFCGTAVFALGVFVSVRFGILKALARSLLG